MTNETTYPGKGQPWADFLHHRARTIDWLCLGPLHAAPSRMSSLPKRPDLIDRFYEIMGGIGKLTAEIEQLSAEGVRLSEAGRTAQAQRILERCERLNSQREALQEQWKSCLRARGIMSD